MIAHLVAYGCSIESASEQCGISKHTFYAWLRRGRAALDAAEPHMPIDSALDVTYRTRLLLSIDEAERPFADFTSAVESALGRAEVGYSLAMRRHADDDWRAAAWWLERRNARLYGSKETIRLGLAGPEPGQMSNEDLVSELQQLGFVQVMPANQLGFAQAPVVEASASLPVAHPHDVGGSGESAPAIGDGHGRTNGHGSNGSNGH